MVSLSSAEFAHSMVSDIKLDAYGTINALHYYNH